MLAACMRPMRFLAGRVSALSIGLLGLCLSLSHVSGAESADRDQATRREGLSLPKSDPRIENLIRDAVKAGRKKQYDTEISKLSAALALARDERSRGYVYFLRADSYRRKKDFG